MVQAESAAHIDGDLAERLAVTLADLPGVQGAVLCSHEGRLLGQGGVPNAPRMAALATFVARRAEALSLDGDLRGMGKVLAESAIQHLAIQGDGGDCAILVTPPCYIVLVLQRAYPADPAVNAARVILRRYL